MKGLNVVALEREIGMRGSLHDFVAMAFPHVETGETFVDNWHIEEICTHLEATWRGELRKVGFCIPPGCMKSLIVSVLFPVWVWIRDPSKRFSVIGYDEGLTATRDGGKVIKLIKSDWFKARWSDRVSVPTDPATGNVKTQGGGFRFATSIGGGYTGQHVHFEIVDDPIKPQDLTKAKLDAVQTWRTRVAPTRLIPPKPGQAGARIYIMQRLHEDDAIGYAEREEGWTFVVFPMRLAGPPCVTQWGGDRRTEEGDLLWPERFDAEEVDSRAKILGPKNTAAQFQQRPVPDGGLIFNSDTFQFYTVAPAKFEQVLMSVDATFKGADTSDFVCIQVWGRKGGSFYLLDMVHARLSFTGTIEAIKRMVRKWPQARTKLIEDKANGPAIIDTLAKEIAGIIPVNPEGGKEARANAVEPYFSAKNVWFPEPAGAVTKTGEAPAPCPWVDTLVAELLGFPFARNDDAVDACTQALLHFRQKANHFIEAMRKLKAG